jgi:hypothetical protein
MNVSSNTYIVGFTCRDPETQLPVLYRLTLTTKAEVVVRPADVLVQIERLTARPAYIEDLADRFKTRFPGHHQLRANVHGVEVVTTRQGTA